MKFISSGFNEDNGLSWVRIEHGGKTFFGYARLHPDDSEIASSFTGCRYAEERATIAALKYEYQLKKKACEECRKFIKKVQEYSKFNSEDPSARAMFRQLNRRVKEVNDLADEINAREFALKVAIHQQDTFSKKMSNKVKND